VCSSDLGYQVAAAMVSARHRYFDIDYSKPTVMLLGQEAAGLPIDAFKLTDIQISIPMATMIDSLNVSSAAGIISYEAVRQRYLAGGELARR
jgi:tRNA G18 (ribose-2'-O)-methylase SpoU